MANCWNHTVHNWLKNHVQERIEVKGTAKTVIVMMVSAFWHGFYPMYYISFLLTGMFVELSKDVYRSRALFSFMTGLQKRIVGNLLTMLILNHIVVLFN